MQRTNRHIGDCSIAAAGPQVQNSLWTQLWELNITLGQFQRSLKTHLFSHWRLQRRVTVFSVRCVQIQRRVTLFSVHCVQIRSLNLLAYNLWDDASWRVFNALHGMQTRSCDENSVRPSVCPSNAWIVTKRQKDMFRFLYDTKDNLS